MKKLFYDSLPAFPRGGMIVDARRMHTDRITHNRVVYISFPKSVPVRKRFRCRAVNSLNNVDEGVEGMKQKQLKSRKIINTKEKYTRFLSCQLRPFCAIDARGDIDSSCTCGGLSTYPLLITSI